MKVRWASLNSGCVAHAFLEDRALDKAKYRKMCRNEAFEARFLHFLKLNPCENYRCKKCNAFVKQVSRLFVEESGCVIRSEQDAALD